MVVVSMAATRAVAGQHVREKRSRTQVEISSISERGLLRNFSKIGTSAKAANAPQNREQVLANGIVVAVSRNDVSVLGRLVLFFEQTGQLLDRPLTAG
jgi:hypothetical protein